MQSLSRLENFLAFFLPHPHTHQKAKLLHWHYLVIYILLFMLLKISLDLIAIYKPGVLGVNSTITLQEIVNNTNKERGSYGIASLRINESLNMAAQAKAKNMFEEDYWAHFSPSGKDPWGFIVGAGYKFSFAGENLARNFYNSEDVVVAWMNSPSHRDNLLNSKYQDIGVAVVDGILQGQRTTLVVQLFGKPQNVATENVSSLVPSPQISVGGKNIEVAGSEFAKIKPIVLSADKNIIPPAIVDPFSAIKTGAFILVSLLGLLLITDFLVLKKRGVFKASSHHFAHLGLLALVGLILIISKAGNII